VLYALPDEIAKITPALRRYLELIFVRDAAFAGTALPPRRVFHIVRTQGWGQFLLDCVSLAYQLGRELARPCVLPARSIREKGV